MNYRDQFIQMILQEYKKKLKIDKTIIICTRKKDWIRVFPHDKNLDLNCELGGAQKDFNWIFLNLDTPIHNSLFELKNTIIHELLHIKYPKLNEKKIERLAAILSS